MISGPDWHYIMPMSDQDDYDVFATDSESLVDSIAGGIEENQEQLEAIHILEDVVSEAEDPVGIYITLFDLNSQLENMQEAGEALVAASREVGEDHHADLVFFLYNQLELFAQLSPEAQSAFERLGHLIAEDDGIFNPNSVELDQRRLNMQDFIPELLLAQHLMQSGRLSPSEFRIIVEDLCWLGGKPEDTPRCCLYVLHDREMPHEGKAIEFLAHDASMPFVDLTLIDPDPEFLEVLPPETCVHRAACVFGQVGGEPMVAVLNPFNLQLIDDVSRRLDCTPHFFLTRAAGYSHFLEVQRQVAGGDSSE